jgi:hypothetical protein
LFLGGGVTTIARVASSMFSSRVNRRAERPAVENPAAAKRASRVLAMRPPVPLPSRIMSVINRVHLRGLRSTRRRVLVVELLVQVEHACGSCPASLVSSRLLCGCGL